MPLPPDLSKPVFTIFPEKADKILANQCTTCSNTIRESDFTDSLARKEYSISGMCQYCLDSVFGECAEDWEDLFEEDEDMF